MRKNWYGSNSLRHMAEKIAMSVLLRLQADEKGSARQAVAAPVIPCLDQALATNAFHLVYQPKIDAHSNDVHSVEALIRWKHPQQGYIPPDRFIPIAEATGKIAEITRWVVGRALTDQRDLVTCGISVPVFINLSGILVGSNAFTDELLAMLASSNGQIGMEITETAVIENPDIAMANLQKIVDSGVPLAIDDYGAGLSSLSYLKKIPAGELKIDRAFISELAKSHRDPLIVRSTIDLAHALGMKVTAEGVENHATMALLRVMGCDYLQGYAISRPVPLAELIAFIIDKPRDAGDSMLTQMLAATRGKRVGNQN